MKITEIITFNDYWNDDRYRLKKSIRNGSPVMMVGDNIYHRERQNTSWIQEDSHHSKPDGSVNLDNLERDTKSNNVLISNCFFYFGSDAPEVNLMSIQYRNGIGYSKKSLAKEEVEKFVYELECKYKKDQNIVIADPFNFDIASKRVDQKTSKIN